jgi:aminoglycoside phosphotransferase (APT) family kinase protein
MTRGWPQRPGAASSRDLLEADQGADVRLDLMPGELVWRIRSAWSPVQVGTPCVVHGDLAASNLLVDGDAVALLDWDEARVDVPWFDLAAIPAPTPLPLPARVGRDRLTAAALAWEVATCWVAEPDYARRRADDLDPAAGAL